ncbi:uncharacterized protein LOC125074813 isoform X1 [Vanessa atalanta]|uniref:uncharacterized protein LOC125074813 isoform X1 n=2 Tax=Vanessa atalanta TaxID=42275 RepID=UPI001FCD12B9|nr:uncharacterized protein LOC125074813 isoform X1 [Vanessa atalanta]
MLKSFYLVLLMASITKPEPASIFDFSYPNIKDDIYEQPVNLMTSKKNPHTKGDVEKPTTEDPWSPYDFSKFDAYLAGLKDDSESNRVKRRAKRRRGHNRHRNKTRSSTVTPEEHESKNVSSTDVPVARRADLSDTQEGKGKKRKKNKKDRHKKYDSYEPPVKEYESSFVEMPKDLYQAHLRPGVIFRIHMSEAILKMQYRNYGEDKDESVIEADVEYLRLTRKVINDEITKFEDLKWLVGWFSNRSELIQEHMCNTRYYAVGIPPTMFTHSEEYMKRMCLFDNVYIDHIPYVVGEDGSLMAAVAPPVLHCDAATCTSVPFIDSIMFDERLSRTNVRTVTRCQASCRAHCRNDPDCLKRCSDRCLRAD